MKAGKKYDVDRLKKTHYCVLIYNNIFMSLFYVCKIDSRRMYKNTFCYIPTYKGTDIGRNLYKFVGNVCNDDNVDYLYLLHVLLTLPQINGNYISQTRIYEPAPPHPRRGYLARTCSAVVMVTPFSFSGCYFLDRIIKHLGRIFRLASKDATVCSM